MSGAGGASPIRASRRPSSLRTRRIGGAGPKPRDTRAHVRTWEIARRSVGPGRDRWAHGLFALASALAIVTVVAIAVDLLIRGGAALQVDLLWRAPEDAGRSGGIGPFVVATAWVLGIALAVTVPVGLLAAIGSAEFAPRRGRERALLQGALDVLAAVPSVIFGLFGLALFCEALGLGWSVASGGLTVSCMILPGFVRIAEEGLRAVPEELRVAGAALGLSRTTVVFRLVLPQAAPTLGAALLLSTGRVLAESAALMFTAGAAVRTPLGPGDPGRVLAYHVYLMAIEVPGGLPRACALALVLLGFVLVIGACARGLPGLVARWAVR